MSVRFDRSALAAAAVAAVIAASASGTAAADPTRDDFGFDCRGKENVLTFTNPVFYANMKVFTTANQEIYNLGMNETMFCPDEPATIKLGLGHFNRSNNVPHVWGGCTVNWGATGKATVSLGLDNRNGSTGNECSVLSIGSPLATCSDDGQGLPGASYANAKDCPK